MEMKDGYDSYMQQCLTLAREALAAGNPPVGAIIVSDGKVIGTGVESGKSSGDITNHAEIMAVRDAIKNGGRDRLPSATMYTSHEPCIMCSYLIRHHRISKIIYGTAVPYIGGATSRFDILATDAIPLWGTAPDIIAGIYSAECDALSEQYRISLVK